MKKTLTLFALCIVIICKAQEIKTISQIAVNGESKIKVIPDQALITFSIETKGLNTKEIKKQNDLKTDVILKFIKSLNISQEDFKTQRVSLNPDFDFEKKKNNYSATQTIEVLLKNFTIYDELIEGVVDKGATTINQVEFQSSKIQEFEIKARKLAIKDAKNKAEDYAGVLGQKVGKAILISDNSEIYRPQPVFYSTKSSNLRILDSQNSTLATGEIEITARVSVNFVLD